MAKILLAGESWMTTSIHVKGFDSFTTVSYYEGAEAFCKALRSAGHQVAYQPSHIAARDFPTTAEGLGAYDVVILSDIGANTLLLYPETFDRAVAGPNRLHALCSYVATGGGLGMIGGYLSFQGIGAKANYRATALAEILPVEMEVGDDREESPQGARCKKSSTPHPITQSLEDTWPDLLGFQRLRAKPGASVLATIDGWPLLVTGEHGSGRVLAFASDIGPHWVPQAFSDWTGYRRLWTAAVSWLAKEIV